MSELKEFLNKKFEHLPTFINSQSNKNGKVGVFCKNGDYNTYYEKQTRFTPDPRYFFWMDFIKTKQLNGEISIYRDKPNGKLFYLILVGQEDKFIEIFPNGCSI